MTTDNVTNGPSGRSRALNGRRCVVENSRVQRNLLTGKLLTSARIVATPLALSAALVVIAPTDASADGGAGAGGIAGGTDAYSAANGGDGVDWTAPGRGGGGGGAGAGGSNSATRGGNGGLGDGGVAGGAGAASRKDNGGDGSHGTGLGQGGAAAGAPLVTFSPWEHI